MKVGGERLGGVGFAPVDLSLGCGLGCCLGLGFGAGLGETLGVGLGAGFARLAVNWWAGEAGIASRFLGGTSDLADLAGDLGEGFLTGDLPVAGLLFGVKDLAFCAGDRGVLLTGAGLCFLA